MAEGVEFRPGDHRQHAGQISGNASVYAPDTGVGVRTAQHRHHHRVAGLHVSGISSLTLNQAKVLFSANRRAYHLAVAA